MRQKNMSDMIGQPDGLDLDENSDWLHTNDSYQRGNPQHGGTQSTPTGKRRVMLYLSDLPMTPTKLILLLFSQDRAAADGDSINVLTKPDSQYVTG